MKNEAFGGKPPSTFSKRPFCLRRKAKLIPPRLAGRIFASTPLRGATACEKFIAAILALLLCSAPVAAAPTLSSEDDQKFDQYQNFEQVRNITVTDDVTTPQITAAGDIRLQIPSAFPALWDSRVDSVTVTGSAVDAGKFNGTVAAVSYEGADKIAVINVSADFAAGESVKIIGLFLEGFYWADDTDRLTLSVTSGGSAVAIDSRYLQVWAGTNEDRYPPDSPTNIQISQTADATVKLTWTDPPDMDASQIQILRGVAPIPISGVAYTEIARGQEEFTDTDVSIGNTVSYMLRATDGLNPSGLSEEVSITVAEQAQPVVCTTDYSPVCGHDDVTYSNACNAAAAGITNYTTGECVVAETPSETPETPVLTAEEQKASAAGITLTELTNAVSGYSDLASSHWSAGFLARLTRDAILSGYPDGTVQPDRTINRAELAKIAANSFVLPADVEVGDFADVASTDWFRPFVRALKAAGASWTAQENYHPAEGVTRGEAIFVLLTAAGIDIGDAPDSNPFPDVNRRHVYASAIAYASGNGIVNGYDNGNFGPGDTLTRAQVAKIVVLIKNKLSE
ncbi:MAG: S-layer homology domain-containing protein [Patescibacteria group bacterium]